MPPEAPGFLLTIFSFVALLGTLVVMHELGHYLVGRWFGVKAEKFSIGFGPQIWGRVDKRGTLWRVAALPLGGYVQFAGDADASSLPDARWRDLPEIDRNQTFPSKPLWQRALIIVAGPATNFLLAILIGAGFMIAFGKSTTAPIINQLAEGGAAEKAGLVKGDRIISINGRAIATFDAIASEIVMIPNEDALFEIERDGRRIEQNIRVAAHDEVDRFGNKYRIGRIGIGSPRPEFREVGIWEAPFAATAQTFNILRQQIKGLGQIIAGRRSVKELGGPLKIAEIAGQAMASGWLSFISLAALISINLGFINLLPIPMLDGGHLFLYAIEAVRRRPPTPQVQEWAFRAGFALVVGFMLMVTFNDLVSFGLFGK